MTDTFTLGFPAAASSLGVSLRVLRRAIHTGRVPAPPHRAATAVLPPEWLASVEAAIATAPKALRGTAKPKVPPFARYAGTSAWRKYNNRVREYNHFNATAKPAGATAAD